MSIVSATSRAFKSIFRPILVKLGMAGRRGPLAVWVLPVLCTFVLVLVALIAIVVVTKKRKRRLR